MRDLIAKLKVDPKDINLNDLSPVNRSALNADTVIASETGLNAVRKNVKKAKLPNDQKSYVIGCYNLFAESNPLVTATEVRSTLSGGGDIFNKEEVELDPSLLDDTKIIRKLLVTTTMKLS